MAYADVVGRYCNGEATSCPAFSQRVYAPWFSALRGQPGVWRFAIGIVVTLLMILAAMTARNYYQIVARCRKQCPKIAAG